MSASTECAAALLSFRYPSSSVIVSTSEFPSLRVAWHSSNIPTRFSNRSKEFSLKFWLLNSSWTRTSILFNVSDLYSNNFSFRWQNSMTDVSVTLRPPCWCPSEGHQHGVSIQSSINLGETLFWIKREWITAEIWIVARLFRYQSSFISQLLDLIYSMVTIIIFNGVTLQPVLKRDFQDFYPRICLLYGNNVWYNSLNMLTLGYWCVKSNLWIFSLCVSYQAKIKQIIRSCFICKKFPCVKPHRGLQFLTNRRKIAENICLPSQYPTTFEVLSQRRNMFEGRIQTRVGFMWIWVKLQNLLKYRLRLFA